jgi:hypothetical protein
MSHVFHDLKNAKIAPKKLSLFTFEIRRNFLVVCQVCLNQLDI